MKHLASLILVGFVLISCAQQRNANWPAPAKAVAPEVATVFQQTWANKKWDGTWGDPCTGSIEVFEVEGNTATVKYTWGQCGGKPGSTVREDAVVDEKMLYVQLRGSTTAVYTLNEDGTLTGRYNRPRDGAKATGRFSPV